MQIEDSRPRWGILFLLFLILGGLSAVPFLFYRPARNLPIYQIQNFAGTAEVYSDKSKRWLPVQRAETITARDKLRTGPKSEIDFGIPKQLAFRLKDDAQLEVKGPAFFQRTSGYRLYLVRGALVGSTDKDYSGAKLEISTPTLVASLDSPMFQMEVKPETSDSAVHILKGSAVVRSTKARQSVRVQSLETTEVKRGARPTEPTRVTRQEWSQMKEAYELIGKGTALEAKQLDLSKEGGSLFQYVIDHGTFYTPEFGHSEREFIKDEATGKVYLKIDYDVFLTGSFVGVYIKTRNLDLAKFKGLEFQARTNPEEGFPESMRIELKTDTGLARVFVPRDFKPTWQTYKYPLVLRRSTPITELALVFSNEKVGNSKKGAVYLRDFNLEVGPPPSVPSVTPAPPATVPRRQPKASPAPDTTQL